MKSKKHMGILFLIASATLLLLFSCKTEAAPATDGTTDTTDNPPAATTYTITIEPNGGTPGSLTKIEKIAVNATVPLPAADTLPKINDATILYWSTEPNNHDKLFEFGTTHVNSNLTIYPHYRYSLAAVKKMMEGNWLIYINNVSTAVKMNKLNAVNSLVAECNQEIPSDFSVLSDASNSATLAYMKNIPIDLTLTNGDHTINGVTYSVSASLEPYNIYIQNYTNPNAGWNPPQCFYGPNLTYNLTDYISTSTDEIRMDKFYNINTNLRDIVLKTYSASSFTYTVTNKDPTAPHSTEEGTFYLVKVN